MRRKLSWHLICATFLGTLLLSPAAFAGGVVVRQATIDGQSEVVIPGNRPVWMCVRLDRYNYSGSPGESAFLLVFIKSAELPRGRIESWFNQQSSRIILMPLDQAFSGERPKSLEQPDGQYCTSFRTPEARGSYYFGYVPRPLFTQVPNRAWISLNVVDIGDPLKNPVVAAHIRDINWIVGYDRLRLEVSNRRKPIYDPPHIYLMVNDEFVPHPKTLLKAGYNERPAKFSWFMQRRSRYDVQFRYIITGNTEKWSPWSSREREAYYRFIFPGVHRFVLQVRYHRYASVSEWQTTRPVEHSFYLEDIFVSGDPDKTLARKRKDLRTQISGIDDVYTKSRAIVFSVGKFKDANFDPLTFTLKDAKETFKALESKNFHVTIVPNADRRTIYTKLHEFFRKNLGNERLIVYLTSHGFPSNQDPEKVYIASTDCDPRYPKATCVDLEDLSELAMASRYLGKHVLFVVDACAAGIGLVKKTAGYEQFFEGAILRENGAHIITAGLAGQVALPGEKGLSVFTEKLLDGLKGAADCNSDGFITLLELMVYTRGEVAKATEGKQTPAMGALFGAGEMVF